MARVSSRIKTAPKKYGEDQVYSGAKQTAPRKAASVAPREVSSSKVKATANAKTKKPATNGAKKPAAKKASATKKVPKKVTKSTTKAAAKVTATTKTMKKEPDTNAKVSRKRKASEDPNAAAAAVKKPKTVAKGPVINRAPTEKLNVYVFGEGSSGELGLGRTNAIDVKRPRLNANLAADKVGVVQIAAGGMHVAALTHDNKILTWGVNDQGALGRSTAWEGGLKDMDDNKSDSGSDSDGEADLNPLECTPTAIPDDKFPPGTVFTQVAAGDSVTFALTDDGKVWGWGTFRSNEGIFGFTKDSVVQTVPLLLPELKKIKKIVCGANHVLALDANGAVFAWGSGQQNQLGRRVVERTKIQGLIPREFGLPKKAIVDVDCGQYHSFAIDNKDRVWAWGLNSFGETGVPEHAGESEAVIYKPELVQSLTGKGVVCINGGAHHSIAVTRSGDCLAWGRVDGCQIGVEPSSLPEEHIIKDERGRVRILTEPTKVPIPDPVAVAKASSDHCIAVTKNGQAYSWGFSANYQTGQGTDDDVELATLIDNSAVRGKQLTGVQTGGQFGILTGPATAGAPQTNGVH